ncbi:gasdermin-A isoform X3 [Gopherus flavomarginatus]|uniref:gasdermin-A isoform X3 n=1 Tax=Gopherus flavomarginatus TaxID=286002 RepID=UPI0021CBEDF6|nr:gasdermin-A isoform X3 [Gopherus flavomarginatus]
MFHKATKDLAKQLAPDGDLLPVSSLIDQDHFRPLYLVRRKPKRSWMTHHRYYKTGVRLSDILVPAQDNRNLDVQDSHTITVEDCSDGRVEWTIKMPEDFVSMEVTGAASTYQVKSIKMKTARVSPAALEILPKERKINMDHSFIKDLRKHRENLYVINEAVQALEETTLYKANTMEGNIRNDICVHFSLKGTRGSKSVIVIPKDCVLAFRIKPLIIQSESWGISHHPDEETFVAEGVTAESDYFPDGGMEGLQSDVEKECAELSQLSTDLRAKFLKSIIAVIINSDLLQELKLKVKSILKQDFHLKHVFSLDAKLLSCLQEEELNITKAMIERGGVTLQRNGPSFTGTGDLAAFSALSALYVALYALHLLSRSD